MQEKLKSLEEVTEVTEDNTPDNIQESSEGTIKTRIDFSITTLHLVTKMCFIF